MIIISVELQAFGFLAAFSIAGVIALMWVKFCLEKKQATA